MGLLLDRQWVDAGLFALNESSVDNDGNDGIIEKTCKHTTTQRRRKFSRYQDPNS
jgi:hypothetical protein